MIQDFLSHGISIPIGSSNKFTKKCCIKIVIIAHWSFQYGPVIKLPLQILPSMAYGIDQSDNFDTTFSQVFFGKSITRPYWNAYPMT